MDKFRKSTKNYYYGIWKKFNSFLLKLDHRPGNWEERVVLYVGYLINTKHKASTINSYVSVIKAVLKDVKVELNKDRYLLNVLMKACKIRNYQLRTRLPIQKPLLGLMLRKIEKLWENQPYLIKLYQAVIVAAYYGMLRISEIAASPHVVKVVDVQVATNKQKFMFILRSLKTHDRDMSPQIIKIASEPRPGGNPHCPHAILLRYSRARATFLLENEQFFVFSDRSPLQANHLRSCMKSIFKAINLNPKVYGTHSYRIGRSVDLLQAGVSVETIKKLGRWRSNTVFKYLNMS